MSTTNFADVLIFCDGLRYSPKQGINFNCFPRFRGIQNLVGRIRLSKEKVFPKHGEEPGTVTSKSILQGQPDHEDGSIEVKPINISFSLLTISQDVM